MSISLEDKGWKCWRVASHRGKNPVRLLMPLLNISFTEAVGLSGNRMNTSYTNLADSVRNLLNGKEAEVIPIKKLEFPPEFRDITNWGASRIAFNYLLSRGYSEDECELLTLKYKLKTAIAGVFSYRIIIPVYMTMGLVNWTGRHIGTSTAIRYRTLTTDRERSKAVGMPQALLSIERTLWNYNAISTDRGRCLVLCEGPFDAIRLDFHGVRATCMFGKNLSEYQVGLLERVRNNYDSLYVVLDRDSQLESLMLTDKLRHLSPRFLRLPSDIKDPAELNRNQIERLVCSTSQST